MFKSTFNLLFSLCLMVMWSISGSPLIGQMVPIGSGGYTLTFPGTDAAGRNAFPSGTPYTIGEAASKPVPTNDWWSAKIKNPHADNLFNYPFTMKTVNDGLVVSYIPWGVIDNILPIVVGVSGLNATSANVSDFSDWTMTMDWRSGNHRFQATSGIGMPFLYFTKDSADVASITVNQGSVTVSSEKLIIENARNGGDFVVYAPTGSSWAQAGNTYTSTLNGENYWSLAFVPLTVANISQVATEYEQYAFVFPTNTTTSWDYNQASGIVHTDFEVEVEVKEGTDSILLQGLLPHQWDHLAPSSPQPMGYTYRTVRGDLKMLASNTFSVEYTFHGILPTLPYVDYYSPSFSPQKLDEKVRLLQQDALNPWTDSYNQGQSMNRLIQTARIADLMGDTVALNMMLQTVKERLEDWLKADPGEVAFLFYYNDNWSAMIGYPAGHGQDGNINDHHFHWGYFIHAAAFLEQYEPGWAAQWGDMINLLVRDAASADRDDPLFPFLRNFSPYAGHCWANGFASFPQGNDQESTSESMQFNSSLIHWGAITGNDSIRDLGIYLYVTEQAAIEEYWFDVHERNFEASHPYSLVARVWGNSYDNGTFWTNDIAAAYGIQMYPIHGGSFYLGQDTTYLNKLWAEIERNTGILNQEVNPNLWHDVYWQYLAFVDPQKAINLYDGNPGRALKFGVSDAQTYHWLHAMQALGRVDASITADDPLAAAFYKPNQTIYVGHNYSDTARTVTFSDGYMLDVPARSMATSEDVSVTGELSASFPAAYPGGSVDLSLQISGGQPVRVEFVDGETLLGQDTLAPFSWTAKQLSVGRHNFYARIYEGDKFAISNFVQVIVGEQLPYKGDPSPIPGVIEAGHYDQFEGGLGQGIAYQDGTPENLGDFRETEYVDANEEGSEGAMVGWLANGEWLEYTVDVQQPGNYNLDLRYISGNNAGGGPMRIESDGKVVKDNITFSYTGNWSTWRTKSVTGVPLKGGEQVLRIFIEGGEFNLGKMTFTYDGPLTYPQPVAQAGDNILVQLPNTTTSLDGSQSTDPDNTPLTYTWTQQYGPSVLNFSDPQVANPSVSNLQEGVYLISLSVSNGQYTDEDEIYIISSVDPNVAPKVSITAPSNLTEYIDGDLVSISATASDLIGEVSRVEFYVDSQLVGSDTQKPYTAEWTSEVGTHTLTAIAIDDDSSATTSDGVSITVVPAPSCTGTSFNGDFSYRFSEDENNPTLTFIPSGAGVGTPTCILYYGTNPNALPGQPVTPNVPFRLNASEGTLIYFYYTYSFPGAVEKNNAGNKDTYVIGSCRVTNLEKGNPLPPLVYYPNPVTQKLFIELPAGQHQIQLFTITGKQLDTHTEVGGLVAYDMSIYPQGIYLIKVINETGTRIVRVVKAE